MTTDDMLGAIVADGWDWWGGCHGVAPTGKAWFCRIRKTVKAANGNKTEDAIQYASGPTWRDAVSGVYEWVGML